MSHSINIQALLEDILVLEHLALGSKAFCASYQIKSFEETGYMEPLSPRTVLKGIVCDKLINVAIKSRILLDHASIDRPGVESIQSKSILGLTISYNAIGSERLSLRETLNKIVHASRVSVDFAESEFEASNVNYWDGQVRLDGSRGSEEWAYFLNVGDWGKALRRVVLQLLREDRLGMLGWDGGL